MLKLCKFTSIFNPSPSSPQEHDLSPFLGLTLNVFLSVGLSQALNAPYVIFCG